MKEKERLKIYKKSLKSFGSIQIIISNDNNNNSDDIIIENIVNDIINSANDNEANENNVNNPTT